MTITTEQFDERLVTKLEAMPPHWLISMLMTYAYEDMCEEFNNEILSDYEDEHREEED